jgi:cell wall-associated NlpC family hydrolase
VIAISGAMVASLALPVSAATVTDKTTTTVPVALPAAAPAAAQAPLAPRTFGSIGFTGVVKPKPKPKPKPRPRPVVVVPQRAAAAVSRSVTRKALSAPKATNPAPAPSSGGVLGIAASLAGIDYVYGGTTPAGFDCSGYTQYVFNKVGISLPRTAEEQRQAATPVSNPQPGDLVFFGSPAFHVGFYAGNGMMWDSPRTGKTTGKHDIWSTSVTYGRP